MFPSADSLNAPARGPLGTEGALRARVHRAIDLALALVSLDALRLPPLDERVERRECEAPLRRHVVTGPGAGARRPGSVAQAPHELECRSELPAATRTAARRAFALSR